MASIKDLKKELIYTYGALLDQCYLVQMVFPNTDPKAAEALAQEIEDAYMSILAKLSRKEGSSPATRAKEVRKEFDASVDSLSKKLEALADGKSEAAPKPKKKAAPKAKAEAKETAEE